MRHTKKPTKQPKQPKRTHLLAFTVNYQNPEGWSADDLRAALPLVEIADQLAAQLPQAPGFSAEFPPTDRRGSFCHPSMIIIRDTLHSLQRAMVIELMIMDEEVPRRFLGLVPGYYARGGK